VAGDRAYPATEPSTFVVYWQPGCTSCLKLREFLRQHAVPFESVNVRQAPLAAEALLALGARSVPVLARGASFVHGQDLDEVARFIGVSDVRRRLSPPQLAERLRTLLESARDFNHELGEDQLETTLPGRHDRTGADLVFHIAMIVEGFLGAASGGHLDYAHFEARPQGSNRTRVALDRVVVEVLGRLGTFQLEPSDRLVGTYYGERTLVSVLERSTWHVAQHVRQLEALIRADGRTPARPLGGNELDGLPIPDAVWDPELLPDP